MAAKRSRSKRIRSPIADTDNHQMFNNTNLPTYTE